MDYDFSLAIEEDPFIESSIERGLYNDIRQPREFVLPHLRIRNHDIFDIPGDMCRFQPQGLSCRADGKIVIGRRDGNRQDKGDRCPQESQDP